MMILKSDEKNMVQKYIFFFFFYNIFIILYNSNCMKNKTKKKDIYILYLSELSQQKDRIKLSYFK